MYLGINQPIPLPILIDTISAFLKGEQMSSEFIYELIKENIKGENRAKKAFSHLNQVLLHNYEFMKYAQKHLNKDSSEMLSASDSEALIFLCLANTYPIIYLTSSIFESLFRTQETVNKTSIIHKITSIHGSNRGIFNALDATTIMMMDMKMIHRLKPALYKRGPRLKIGLDFMFEQCIYIDIKHSGSKSILIEDIDHRAWYANFVFTIPKPEEFRLLKYSESRTGMGYLTIK